LGIGKCHMPKHMNRFQTIPLERVPAVCVNDNAKEIRAADSSIVSNVQKRAARPKRSISTEGKDHPLGLWIDRDALRRHQNRPPQLALQNPLTSANNRYLALADFALGNNKPRKKAVVQAIDSAPAWNWRGERVR